MYPPLILPFKYPLSCPFKLLCDNIYARFLLASHIYTVFLLPGSPHNYYYSIMFHSHHLCFRISYSQRTIIHFTEKLIPYSQYTFLSILKGEKSTVKKTPAITQKRIQTFWELVHQINSLQEVLKLKQNFLKK